MAGACHGLIYRLFIPIPWLLKSRWNSKGILAILEASLRYQLDIQHGRVSNIWHYLGSGFRDSDWYKLVKILCGRQISAHFRPRPQNKSIISGPLERGCFTSRRALLYICKNFLQLILRVFCWCLAKILRVYSSNKVGSRTSHTRDYCTICLPHRLAAKAIIHKCPFLPSVLLLASFWKLYDAFPTLWSGQLLRKILHRHEVTMCELRIGLFPGFYWIGATGLPRQAWQALNNPTISTLVVTNRQQPSCKTGNVLRGRRLKETFEMRGLKRHVG